MTATNIVHKIAHLKQSSARLAELQEWLECNDFILAMKCAFMNPDGNLKSLRHLIITIGFDQIVARIRNAKILAFLPNAVTQFTIDLWRLAPEWAKEMQSKIPEGGVMLKNAALDEKREVLRHMQIVTTPVAAAYLGITEDMLNRMAHKNNRMFGAQYAGGYCYSLEELNLIAQNLQWTCEWDYEKVVEHKVVDSTVLDYAILVDEATAMALTDATLAELNNLLTKTEHTRRPYRLADLEKVRVAKLEWAKFLPVEAL